MARVHTSNGGAERGSVEYVHLVLSCHICQAIIPTIYAKPDGDEGLHDGSDGPKGAVTKLWIGNCSHVTCGKHLNGGGAPFHPDGEQPKTACPVCTRDNGDSSLRRFYGIRGTGKDEYDPRVPKLWLTIPPIRLSNGSDVEQALRFQLFNLAHYGLRMTKHRTTAEDARRQLESLYTEERQTSEELRKNLQQTQYLLEKKLAQAASSKEILKAVPLMMSDLSIMRHQLDSLGYSVPRCQYLQRYATQVSSNPHAKNDIGASGSHPPHERPLRDLKRTYRDSDGNGDEAEDDLQRSGLRSSDLMPPPRLKRRTDGAAPLSDSPASPELRDRFRLHRAQCMEPDGRLYDDAAHRSLEFLQRDIPIETQFDAVSNKSFSPPPILRIANRPQQAYRGDSGIIPRPAHDVETLARHSSSASRNLRMRDSLVQQELERRPDTSQQHQVQQFAFSASSQSKKASEHFDDGYGDHSHSAFHKPARGSLNLPQTPVPRDGIRGGTAMVASPFFRRNSPYRTDIPQKGRATFVDHNNVTPLRSSIHGSTASGQATHEGYYYQNMRSQHQPAITKSRAPAVTASLPMAQCRPVSVQHELLSSPQRLHGRPSLFRRHDRNATQNSSNPMKPAAQRIRVSLPMTSSSSFANTGTRDNVLENVKGVKGSASYGDSAYRHVRGSVRGPLYDTPRQIFTAAGRRPARR